MKYVLFEQKMINARNECFLVGKNLYYATCLKNVVNFLDA